MFGLEQQNKKKSVDQRLEELEIQLASMSKEREALLEELGATPSEIEEFLSNRERFSDEEWALLQRCREDLDEISKRAHENIVDPKATQQRRKESVQPPNWIPVR